MLNIVSSYQTLQEFKKSRYFRVSLGLVPTVEKNGSRVFNDKDRFAKFYNMQYNTTIYGQGNVGDIKFYVDHYIRDSSFAVYSDDFQEFLFQLDPLMIREKGIEFYLGHILKTTEEEYDERVKMNELKKIEEKPVGVAEKVFSNPGNVNYEDLKAYLAEKNKSRYL
jgi:hypothetical protein